MKVLLDTNILLDVLLQRQPFFPASCEIWTLAEEGTVTAYISALSLPNVYYVISRGNGAKVARRAIGLLRGLFEIVELNADVLNQAAEAAFADFEDAIQYVSALRAGAAVLITRNPRHFPSGTIKVLTPTEFLHSEFANPA